MSSRNRVVILLLNGSVWVDWLTLLPNLSPEYWSDWHSLIFISMDARTEWPRWLHGIQEAMKQDGDLLDMGARGEFVLLTPHDTSRARAFVMPGTNRMEGVKRNGLIIFSDGGSEQDAAWIRRILWATEQLSSDLIAFPWKAAIGPFPHQNLGAKSTRLSLNEAITIGGMRIEPLNKCIVDRFFHRRFPSLMSLGHTESWPLSVAGDAFGYEPSALRESVTRDLVLLCAVFSLASGIPWVVRELPFTSGDNEVHISEKFYGPESPAEEEGPEPFTLPAWADDAYRFAKQNEDYRNALLMYSEALQIEGPHPSITLISYMACLQSLGRVIEPNRDKQTEAILAKVRDGDRVKPFLKKYYGYRSETAHRGVLHDTEDIAHAPSMEFHPFGQFREPFWSGLMQAKETLMDAFSWILTNQSDGTKS